jgi:hypothetical protein
MEVSNEDFEFFVSLSLAGVMSNLPVGPVVGPEPPVVPPPGTAPKGTRPSTAPKIEPPVKTQTEPGQQTTSKTLPRRATPPPTPEKAVVSESPAKRSQPSKATTQREMEEAAAQKTATVTAKGQAEYRVLPGRAADIGVLEVRADNSVSIVAANRENVRELTGSNTHIALANAPEGLGPITAGAKRYRFYLHNGVVTSLEPLGATEQTGELVGVIKRALQRNRLVSPSGTRIDLAPGKPPSNLKETIFPR